MVRVAVNADWPVSSSTTELTSTLVWHSAARYIEFSYSLLSSSWMSVPIYLTVESALFSVRGLLSVAGPTSIKSMQSPSASHTRSLLTSHSLVSHSMLNRVLRLLNYSSSSLRDSSVWRSSLLRSLRTCRQVICYSIGSNARRFISFRSLFTSDWIASRP